MFRRVDDCFVIGRGLVPVARVARLKALGVESVVVDYHLKFCDSWARRYDCVRFHVPPPTLRCRMQVSCCHTSCQAGSWLTYDDWLEYREELQSPRLLTRNKVAEHPQQYLHHKLCAQHLLINGCSIKRMQNDREKAPVIVSNDKPSLNNATHIKHKTIHSTQTYIPAFLTPAHLYHLVPKTINGSRSKTIVCKH
jgi:hypothetical protein